MDPTAQFKENQKAAWSTFALFESMTGTVAPRLVSFAGSSPGRACWTSAAEPVWSG